MVERSESAFVRRRWLELLQLAACAVSLVISEDTGASVGLSRSLRLLLVSQVITQLHTGACAPVLGLLPIGLTLGLTTSALVRSVHRVGGGQPRQAGPLRDAERPLADEGIWAAHT